MPNIVSRKFVRLIEILPIKEDSGDCRAFYITSQNEFITVIWNLIERYGVSPHGRGSWNQIGARENFFQYNGYQEYLMYVSIKQITAEDWYLVQYDRTERDHPFYVISLTDVKSRYQQFIQQFDSINNS